MKQRHSFLVHVIGQQNSTWQGTVTWTEENQTKNFRSLLELIKMIDAALEEDEDSSTAV